jgi:PleD family two-component response regulator
MELRVTMTFGIAVYRKGDSIDAVIKDADDALYRGKQQGRNRVITKS